MGAGPTAQPSQHTISRRSLFKYGAATGAVATVAGVTPAAAAHSHRVPRVLPAPRPIPGGTQIPGGPLIHVFAPGPPEVTLPFTGLQLQGLDVEPSVITDYRGVTALAYVVGAATGSDGSSTTSRRTCGPWRAATSPPTGPGSGDCSPSYESTCSSPVRAPRSTTSTPASSPRACSGWCSCPGMPSRSATTGAARLDAEDVCVLDSFQFPEPTALPPRSASRSAGRRPARRSVAAAARRSRRPIRRRSWAASRRRGRPGRSPARRWGSASPTAGTPTAPSRSWVPNATACSSHRRANPGFLRRVRAAGRRARKGCGAPGLWGVPAELPGLGRRYRCGIELQHASSNQGRVETAAAGGTDRRSAPRAAASIDESCECIRSVWPLHSNEGP
jgi:TAT (twin-arginine translocation) pathway signal sequence